jgi:hypothetical protein
LRLQGSLPSFPVIGLPRDTIHRAIGTLSNGYDWVIIDGPPRICQRIGFAESAAVGKTVLKTEPAGLAAGEVRGSSGKSWQQ